jgi:hypothetical protein
MNKLNYCLRTMSPISVVGLFSLLMMLSPLMTTTAHAQQEIRETSFRTDSGDPDRYRLFDNDVIHLKIEKVPELKDKIEIVLKTSSNISWWKGITVYKYLTDVSRREKRVRLNHIDAQDDDHGPESVIINVSDLGDVSWLLFEKGKAFGVHTPMYSFFLKKKGDKDFKYAGHRLTFTWERDG